MSNTPQTSADPRRSELDAMFGDDPLDPELAAYLTDDGTMPMLRHPLVYSVPHMPMLNRLVNAQLADRKQRLAEAQRGQDWDRYVFLHERPYRLDALMRHAHRMRPRAYWQLVANVWTDCENHWEVRDLWHVALSFRHRDRWAMMESEERRKLRALPARVTVYRGVRNSAYQDGMSWTTERDTAFWFARRLARAGDRGRVIEGTVRLSDIVALLDRRGEHEVVLLPETVTVTARHRA